MRVLWFTSAYTKYLHHQADYNGGGWVSSLEESIMADPSNVVELGIAYVANGQPFCINNDGIVYYSIPDKYLKRSHFISRFYADQSSRDTLILECAEKVVEDFKPDIIHVFGSENVFGLLYRYVKVPIVIHIQGVLGPCFNAFLPPFVSWNQYMLSDLNPLNCMRRFLEMREWKYRVEREKEILKNISYYFGRTFWDEKLSCIYNPSRKYFHINEIMRSVFYRKPYRKEQDKFVIVSVISNPLYKGFDFILKVANILTELIGPGFEWKVFGKTSKKFEEHSTGCRSSELGIVMCGIGTAEEVRDAMLSASVYFHPSYIDNSPNSICEAQMCGCPVVSTNVGGIPQLVRNDATGFLVPTNDPFLAAYYLFLLHNSPELSERISKLAYEEASERHSKNRIVEDLLQSYHAIISQDNLPKIL